MPKERKFIVKKTLFFIEQSLLIWHCIYSVLKKQTKTKYQIWEIIETNV